MLQKISSFLLLYSMCIFASTLYAQDANLSALQKKYTAYSSFSVNFTQDLYNSETKESDKRTGTFTFKKPLLILWKTETPWPQNIIVSQNEIWDYLPEDNTAFKYPISLLNDVAVFAYILSGQANIEDTFSIKKMEKVNDKLVYSLVPKKEHPAITAMLLTISEKTHEIIEVKITDFYANTNTITLSKFTPNIPVENSIFTFKPTENITVIDNTVDDAND